MSLVANLSTNCPDYKDYQCRRSWSAASRPDVAEHWAVLRSKMADSQTQSSSTNLHKKTAVTQLSINKHPYAARNETSCDCIQNGQVLPEISARSARTCCGRCGANPQIGRNGDGVADPIGYPVFACVPKHDLHGAGPDDYTVPSARPHASAKSPLKTSANQRARSGFVYWWMPRPKPTRYGSYSIGTYKTTLGLSFAPRS